MFLLFEAASAGQAGSCGRFPDGGGLAARGDRRGPRVPARGLPPLVVLPGRARRWMGVGVCGSGLVDAGAFARPPGSAHASRFTAEDGGCKTARPRLPDEAAGRSGSTGSGPLAGLDPFRRLGEPAGANLEGKSVFWNTPCRSGRGHKTTAGRCRRQVSDRTSWEHPQASHRGSPSLCDPSAGGAANTGAPPDTASLRGWQARSPSSPRTTVWALFGAPTLGGRRRSTSRRRGASTGTLEVAPTPPPQPTPR